MRPVTGSERRSAMFDVFPRQRSPFAWMARVGMDAFCTGSFGELGSSSGVGRVFEVVARRSPPGTTAASTTSTRDDVDSWIAAACDSTRSNLCDFDSRL